MLCFADEFVFFVRQYFEQGVIFCFTDEFFWGGHYFCLADEILAGPKNSSVKHTLLEIMTGKNFLQFKIF